MTPYQLVRLTCREVARNEQAGGKLCPFCRGGRHGERSLSVLTRYDGVSLYLCHRASCGASGRVLPNGNVSSGELKPLGFEPRPFTEETRALNPEERELLGAMYGLTQREINWFGLTLTSKQGDLVIPISGPLGQKRGHITRPIKGNGGVKGLPYKILDEPFKGWFWLEGSKPERIVIVEDAISAMRVARSFYSVALLGTNLSQEDMFEILRFSDQIVLALDKDATKKALEYQAKYKFLCPQMVVAILDKDLKYLSDLEILEKVA